MQLLVRTPRPFPTESLFGYILRVSEANGYDSPSLILSHTGYSGGSTMAVDLPLVRIEQILGFEPGALAPIAYVRSSCAGTKQFCLLGQPSDGRYRPTVLRRQAPALCPHCVHEKGFLDALWDIRLVVACPVHRCVLLESCPKCKQRLSWWRPSVLTCRCGANLAHTRLAPVDSAITTLMSIVQHSLHRAPVVDASNLAELPVQELAAVPLWNFFALLHKLSLYNQVSHGKEPETDIAYAAMHAAEVLENWPRGFYNFLDRLGKQNAARRPGITMNVRFRNFYSSLFKSRAYCPSYAFLREEYTRFGATEWGEGLVDVRTPDLASDEKRYVSKAELARFLGVAKGSVDSWIRQGTLSVKKVAVGSRTRYIADTKQVTVSRRTEGKTFKDREAGKFLGLPVSVLKDLRKTGHYEVRYMPTRLDAFHEMDLRRFLTLLLDLASNAPMCTEVPPYVLTLGHILRHVKFGAPGRKAELVRWYLDGEVKPVCKCGERVEDICFAKALVCELARTGLNHAGLSVNQVTARLHCSALTVISLVEANILVCVDALKPYRVTRESAEAFGRKYVSITALSREQAAKTTTLVGLAKALNLTLLEIPTQSGAYVTPWVLREEVLLLLERLKYGIRLASK